MVTYNTENEEMQSLSWRVGLPTAPY